VSQQASEPAALFGFGIEAAAQIVPFVLQHLHQLFEGPHPLFEDGGGDRFGGCFWGWYRRRLGRVHPEQFRGLDAPLSADVIADSRELAPLDSLQKPAAADS
jgi:hypothetical protein